MADCPECEYCCAIGLCCPDGAAQKAALVKIMVAATGGTPEQAAPYAQAIVDARSKSQKKA